MLVAMTLEGVLRSPVGQAPIPEGLDLYRSLVGAQRLAVVLDDVDRAGAALWLKREGLQDYVLLHPQRLVDRSLPTPRLGQLTRLRAQDAINMVIDPDPVVVAGAMALGMTSLLFAHPRVARPEFRPDHVNEPRPWNDLVAEIDFQRTVEPPLPVQ